MIHSNRIIGWKAIACELGASESRIKSMFRRAGVRLPKIGRRGRTSPVYLDRSQLLRAVLKNGLRALKGRLKAI